MASSIPFPNAGTVAGLALNRQTSPQNPTSGPREDDWDNSTPSDRQTDSSEIDRRDREVLRIARTMTEQSVPKRTKAADDTTDVNPFHDTSDPALDPKSGKFDAEAWVHQLLSIINRDPERYPMRSAGVSYRNLNVHGFGSPTDFQKEVLNVFLEIPNLLHKITGKGQRKVQILNEFDGLVNAGEMLVVLGRPGR